MCLVQPDKRKSGPVEVQNKIGHRELQQHQDDFYGNGQVWQFGIISGAVSQTAKIIRQ